MTALANSPEFHYRGGRLHVEALALAAIAQEVGTPFYCYSSAAIRRSYEAFTSALQGLDPVDVAVIVLNRPVQPVVQDGAGEGGAAGGAAANVAHRAGFGGMNSAADFLVQHLVVG